MTTPRRTVADRVIATLILALPVAIALTAEAAESLPSPGVVWWLARTRWENTR